LQHFLQLRKLSRAARKAHVVQAWCGMSAKDVCYMSAKVENRASTAQRRQSDDSPVVAVATDEVAEVLAAVT